MTKVADIRTIILLALELTLCFACAGDPKERQSAYLKGGAEYFQDGKYEHAAIEFRNAVEIAPGLGEAHYQLGRTYLALGRPEAAVSELRTAVSLDPEHSEAILQLAMLLIVRREHDEARSLAESILKTKPDNAQAHAILGASHVANRDLQEAIAEFQKSVELDPQRIQGYNALGAVYLAAGQPLEAEAAYLQAIAVSARAVQPRMALGQFYFSQGRLSEAEKEIRVGCDLDPNAVAPRFLLAEIQQAAGKFVDAEKTYFELKTIAPGDPQARQGLALYYRSTGQPEKAAAELKSILASTPNDIVIKRYLVEALIDLGRIDEAEALNQEVLYSDKADAKGLLAEARIQISKKRYQDAITAVDRSVESGGESAQSQYILGLAQRSLGLLQLAKTSFTRALELSPEMNAAALELSQLQFRSGNYDEALHLTDQVLSEYPHSSAAMTVRATAALANGDARHGEELLEEALSSDSVSLAALSSLLALHARQGRAAETVSRIAELIEVRPPNAGLHFLLAVGYFSLHDLEKSKVNVLRAIRLDPKIPGAHTLLANIELANGSVETAKTHFRAAIRLNPSSVTNYMALKELYEKEGDWAEVGILYQHAHEADPESPRLANDLAYHYLEHGGDVNAALLLARMAKQKMPDSAVVTNTLGWAYYKTGRFQSAISQLKESTEMAPNNALYHYHLGMAYVAANQTESARSSFQQAIKRNLDSKYAMIASAALDGLSQSSSEITNR